MMMMAGARFGDANLNGAENDDRQAGHNQQEYDGTARRLTRQFGPSATDAGQQQQFVFKEFTRESLANIQRRKLSRSKRYSVANVDTAKQKPEPDPYLASGVQLPQYILRRVPPELIGKPIEDIDPYYADKETFVIISRGKELIRFSANKALYLFGPFHPIRRIVLYILVSSVFNLFVILTILINCILMTIQGSETVERTIEETEIIFTIIYTFEFILKVMARGFMFDEFAYLRDPWNILDVTVITLSYLTIVIQDLGNLSVMRTFRVLRALKTVAVVPGMKTIVGAVIDSVKNLKDVVVLTLFSLSVFSLLGLQIYMGLLTQKCILNGPSDMNDTEWYSWNSNSSNWLLDKDSETKSYKLCGNATGAQSCPPERTCLQGFGPNPDYGFTNFDTFGWSLICSFRLMTQDYWEGLYMQILKTAGSWHIIFFIVSIFLGSIYLMNLILAIVAMSYNELQRRAEEEEEANIEDEAAFLESCRMMEMQNERGGCCSDENSVQNGSQLGLSFRPSVEIGLVGQTLLASFCQNGLLDERTREKLDNQMMFSPSMSPSGGAGAYRSRSLCLNIDRRHHHHNQHQHQHNHHRPYNHRPSNQWMQYGLLVPYCSHNTNNNPMMAASMNELSRRKSSIRTNSSGGASPKCNTSRQGSLVGQRRLMRDISISGHRLDSDRLRRQRQKLSPHHVSSNVLMPGSNYNNNSNNNNNESSLFHTTRTTRSSITSDKDLQILKQKAARIRIVSDDCCENIPEDETFKLQASHGDGEQDNLLTTDLGNLDGSRYSRSASVQMSRMRRQRTGSSLSSAAQLYTSPSGSDLSTVQTYRYKSEAAICEQPTVVHPLGRMVAKQNLAHLSSTSLQPGRGSFRRRRRSSQRKPSDGSSRRCSTLSNAGRSDSSYLVETPIDDRNDKQEHHQQERKQSCANSPKDGGGGGGGAYSGFSHLQPHPPRQSSSIINIVAPGEMSNLSLSGNKSCSLRTLRSSANRLNVTDFAGANNQDRLRHLSVENFQQFGALRSLQRPASGSRSMAGGSSISGGCGGVSSSGSKQDLSRTPPTPTLEYKQLPPGNELDSVNEQTIAETATTADDSNRAETQMSPARKQPLIGRHSLRQQHRPRDASDNITITTSSSIQPRSSFSRLRHSILPASYMTPTCEQQEYLQQQQEQQRRPQNQPLGAGSHQQPAMPHSQLRRLSRDFVRQADEWSRLSMSGNVDLRRLLRLWSQTNPYQNRSSIGSCSLYSQASQVSRYNGGGGGGEPSVANNNQSNYGPGSNIRAGITTRPRGSQQLYNYHQHRYSSSTRGSPLGSQMFQACEVLSAVNGRNNRYQSDARAYGTAIPLDDNLLAEQMSISTRDKCIAYCLSCLDILCIWECCEGWIKLQRLIALVVFDPFTELFILLCILINTLFMALDNDDVDEQMRRLFEQGNYFFTATFVVEAVMKIIALSPKFYFREGFNVFDAIIVGLSLLELGLEGVYGLSVLRTFRLLRVFRLARSWPTMNVLISICGHAISDLGNLTFVLAIIVFIFAVMGMQLFGNKYTAASFADGVVPRWNFNDFMHSFMIVFRILCAEWIEPLWDCMNAAPKEICIPFFITAVIIGNLVLLNLFLALLLASFGSSNLSGPQADHVDTRKLQEAIARFKRFGRFTRRVSRRCVIRLTSWLLCRNPPTNEGIGGPLADDKQDKRIKSHIASMSRQERQQNIERRTEELKSKIRRSPEHHYHLKQLARSELESS